MAKLTYINNGKIESVDGNDYVFASDWNPNLVKQVIVAIDSNSRANTAQAKDRSQVKGSDKKPWRQKGTGRARHGSRYSPIWRGGGITFGPLTDRNYTKKVNRKARNTALRSVLSKRVTDDQLTVIDLPELKAPKTSEIAQWLASASKSAKNSDLKTGTAHQVTIVIDNPSDIIRKSARNLPGIQVVSVADLNAASALLSKQLVLAGKEAVKSLESRLS